MNSNASHEAAGGTSPRFLPALLLLFVGSGCAALIYEIIWYQMLQLVIGLTTISLGVLLGTFMGGMCLGSLLLPRIISERFHPLRVYAFLELGIGAIGVGVYFGMPLLADYYTQNFGKVGGGLALRAGIAAICLLPPTLLMGATLPAIARWVKSDPKGVSWLGFFYGGNIAGAVFGCLLAGFYLLRKHDIAFGTFTAVAINVAVAALAFTLAAYSPHKSHAAEPKEDSGDTRRSPFAAAAYIAVALSGLTALGAEVIWARQLGLIIGGTVYTFSIILGVFLAGLGIGSTAGAYVARESRHPMLLLGTCQLLLTAAIFWTALMITQSLPHWPIDPSLSSSPWYAFQLDMARTIWAIFPATLLWGASFPLALAAAAAPGQDPGRLVGGVYAANTVGAIAGALGASVVFIPFFGTQGAQQWMIALAALSAAIALAPSALASSRSGLPAAAAARGYALAALAILPLLSVILIRQVEASPWGLIAYGRNLATWRDSIQPNVLASPSLVPRNDGTDDVYCIYQGEGVNGSVVVTESTGGIRSFHAAGKVQASNDPLDMKLQRMLGHISALAIEEPKSVLVIACGAGVTAGTFLLHPTIEEIVICDIEDLVPKYVAPLFSRENYGIADRALTENPVEIEVNGKMKKVTFVYDDGRHYIRTIDRKFDIISSDPVDPWVKGQAALNTVEYYEMCKEKLNPGGVMSLWIPLYEGKLETTKSIIGTFFTVFDKGIVWSNDDAGAGYDAVLFGQPEGSHFDIDRLQQRLFDAPLVMESLDDVGLESAIDLLASFAAYGPHMKAWMADAAINRDRDMRLQYIAGMHVNTWVSEDILDDILKHRRFPDELFSGSQESMTALRRRLGDY